MCGRYTLRKMGLTRKELAEQLRLPFEDFDDVRITPRFNVAPSQHMPILRLTEDGRGELALARWGLIPSWTKGKPTMQPINARSETVATSGMFRQAWRWRRCLVPADGFYEWQTGGPVKQPMFIHRPDDSLFCFAGLWERWQPDPDAEPVDTYTILTTRPNGDMAPIHDRMPVILERADWAEWMDHDRTPDELLKPAPDGSLYPYPVTKHVNYPRNDDAQCIRPMGE